MIRHLLCIFLAVLLLLLSFGISPLYAEDYASLRNDYTQLTTSTQLQRQRVNWERLIQRFDRFIATNPRSANIDNAHFLRARTWDGLSRASGRASDARRAIDLYLELANRFPASRFADDALYHAGQIAENHLKDPVAAAAYYRRVISETPDGDMVPEARQRLAALPQQRIPEDTAAPSPAAPPSVTYRDDHRATASSPTLEGIRFWSGPEYTRIVLDLSAPVVAQPNVLSGESPRIFFDLVYTDLAETVPATIEIDNGLVRRVRSSRFDTQRTRVVIDLEQVREYRVISLDSPYRLVIDVMGVPSTTAMAQTPLPRKLSPQADDSIAGILDTAVDRQPELRVRQHSGKEGIRLIVIDPGHGGRDPGAIGPSGIMEKNVNLALAKITAEALRKQLGVKVMLTRENDSYLELRERTAFANRVGADLFISLHANASNSSRPYGVETYFLNLSKTDEAAAVAARENGMTMEDISHLEAILFDLMANAKINESSRLAAEIQQSMVRELSPRYNHIRDLGVKQGPFHVLLGANMPSALVEAAFITNEREEKRLNSVDYQRRIADAIVKAVKNYATAMGQATWN